MKHDAVDVAGWLASPDRAMLMEEGGYASLSNRLGGAARAAAPHRMVNYNGNINLQSPEPGAVIDSAIQMAKGIGGFAENRYGNRSVALKIPSKQFRDFFSQILSLGIVLHKEIFANDITDAYQDNELRLRIAQDLLARLQELLQNSKSDKEKITLLKEIQRVNEEIERRKITERELARKAEFATLNLNVEPVVYHHGKEYAPRGFEWFYGIDNQNKVLGTPVKFPIPKNFVESVDTKKKWASASSDGVEFSAFEVETNIEGNNEFWTKAMQNHFKNSYKTSLENEGNYSLLRLEPFNPNQPVCYIILPKHKNKIKIARVMFPNSNLEQKHSSAVKDAVKEAK